ncbi:hypothetical protein GCM10017764_09760 [Sphingobacterium griseoflavum]|uniref:Uncharacterized protein n=1 Tax=Sphingobacterium griseoflavum TaxID=1474952 RepID=A0ABQ3HUG7_9SPHI|nr:hypothetical protein GCM10017764_09760 [Sphingobacterium griseoflavum]
MAGFVLTFLTIIVTFKESSKEISTEKDITTIKEHFYNSTLYPETVKHIKNTLKSLIIASIFIYMGRIFVSENHVLLYYVSLYGIVVLLISILKSLYIISKVIDLQIAK